jgi:hypothetical protein
MSNKKPKIPPLTRVYWTAELKKVAMARLQGGISWAELLIVNSSIKAQPGILLFDSVEAATAYIQKRKESFAVVVELPVSSIEKELLVRCEEFSGREFSGQFRQWIYPHHIWFDQVRFHKIQTVAQEVDPADLAATPVRATVLASSRPRDVTIDPDGTITIPDAH